MTQAPPSNIDLFLESLGWRYATKLFDPSRHVSEADLQKLLDATRLTASSYGLQPWKFFVITDRAIRIKLREHSWKQPQITDCSHLIVLASKTTIDLDYVESHTKLLSKERDLPGVALEGFKTMVASVLPALTGEAGRDWMARQTYIALGTLLSACAMARIDACPMEGFDHEGYDEVLGLTKDGFTATVLCAIGYRSEADKASTLKKVRHPAEDVIVVRR